MNFVQIVATFIVFLSIINLLRMSLFLIGSDIYGLMGHLRQRKIKQQNFPTFSVVIPAHNEEASILRSVSSVLNNDYPKDRFEITVVDDGSIDNTLKILNNYKIQTRADNLYIISQTNQGKAHALNTGMKSSKSGVLVMCLDGDSFLAHDALKKAAKYFDDEKTVALAANVKIAKSKGLFNLIQQVEYIVCYQMKRAQSAFNIEYIIGGIGSTFRRNFLEKINYYDANTVTEDIDITMKLLQFGNKKIKLMHGYDVVAYTQSVLSFSDLIRQRYRWKWGRYQTFLKNKSMFFSNKKIFTKGLVWLYLPYALFSDFIFLFEPIVIGYIIFITFYFKDIFTIVSALCVISFYMAMNILAEETTPMGEKLKLLAVAPMMYFLFYALSFVEYVALIKSLFNIRSLKKSITKDRYTWKPVKRIGFAISLGFN